MLDFLLTAVYYICNRRYCKLCSFYASFSHTKKEFQYLYIKDVIIMKIEKVNDHQIRCTLTKADLADRELKISELAYGTEKAKSLFRDMMQQAAIKFGFEAEDIPLMIEAIP